MRSRIPVGLPSCLANDQFLVTPKLVGEQ
jgi:hypothetical protein